MKNLRAQLHQILADCEILLQRCDANSQAFHSTEAKVMIFCNLGDQNQIGREYYSFDKICI